jgi:hypothetical protein
MLAASSVVSCPIQSVYPPRNGFLDKAIGILHTIFNPMGKDLLVTISIHVNTLSCVANLSLPTILTDNALKRQFPFPET